MAKILTLLDPGGAFSAFVILIFELFCVRGNIFCMYGIHTYKHLTNPERLPQTLSNLVLIKVLGAAMKEKTLNSRVSVCASPDTCFCFADWECWSGGVEMN